MSDWIMFVWKGSLWDLLVRQSMQENCFIESKTGNENYDIIIFKIDKDGCPSLECHEESDVFGKGEAMKVVILVGGTGHS